MFVLSVCEISFPQETDRTIKQFGSFSLPAARGEIQKWKPGGVFNLAKFRVYFRDLLTKILRVFEGKVVIAAQTRSLRTDV